MDIEQSFVNIQEQDVYTFFTETLPLRDPTFEVRLEQIQLSEKIYQTMQKGEVLIAEAGTGIGKSFAYLVPALLFAQAGYKVVIITATIALQHQLADHDIPRMQQLLDSNVAISVLKGRSNYLCGRQLTTFLQGEEGALFKDENVLKALHTWAQNTTTGDKEEIGAKITMSHSLWSKICTHEFSCGGLSCSASNFSGCHYVEARRKAQQGSIVVTNYNLLAYHLLNQNEENESEHILLPEDAIYILDEAHRLPQITRDCSSTSIAVTEITRVFDSLFGKSGQITHARKLRGEFSEHVSQLISQCQTIHTTIVQSLENIYKSIRMSIEKITLQKYKYEEVVSDEIVDMFYSISVSMEEMGETLTQLAQQLEATDNALHAIIIRQSVWWKEQKEIAHRMEQKEAIPEVVRWCELSEEKGYAIFSCIPLFVNELLNERLFNRAQSIVCTSATMTVKKTFDYWKRKSGVPSKSNEMILPSPFPYKNRVLFGVSTDAPEPNDKKYAAYLGNALPQLLTMTKGRSLILCTSNAMVKQLGGILKQCADKETWNVLLQNEAASNTVLADTFRNTPQSVLVATASFWEGFDAPGDTLRLLVITRIPFTSPEDLFFREESEYLQQRNMNPFMELSIPQAEMKLRQGFGRLMRSADDGGIVLLTDHRIVSKWYGKLLYNTLPECISCIQPMDIILRESKSHLEQIMRIPEKTFRT